MELIMSSGIFMLKCLVLYFENCCQYIVTFQASLTIVFVIFQHFKSNISNKYKSFYFELLEIKSLTLANFAHALLLSDAKLSTNFNSIRI